METREEFVPLAPCHANQVTHPCLVAKAVPNVAQDKLPPFDYIVVATKNCRDVGPTVEEIIAPAVTDSRTVIVLVQNGLNIEKPLIKAFPRNVVLSGISLIGVAEKGHGNIVHDYHDELIVGAFKNPNVTADTARTAATEFVGLYGASGKVTCELNENVDFVRWRKLIYNASFNPISTITGMDTTRLRLAETPIETLVKPAMWEIWSAAKAAGHDIPKTHIESTINIDPMEVYCKPSMLQDIEKVSKLSSVGSISPLLTAPRVTTSSSRIFSESQLERQKSLECRRRHSRSCTGSVQHCNGRTKRLRAWSRCRQEHLRPDLRIAFVHGCKHWR